MNKHTKNRREKKQKKGKKKKIRSGYKRGRGTESTLVKWTLVHFLHLHHFAAAHLFVHPITSPLVYLCYVSCTPFIFDTVLHTHTHKTSSSSSFWSFWSFICVLRLDFLSFLSIAFQCRWSQLAGAISGACMRLGDE